MEMSDFRYDIQYAESMINFLKKCFLQILFYNKGKLIKIILYFYRNSCLIFLTRFSPKLKDGQIIQEWKARKKPKILPVLRQSRNRRP